MSLMREEIHQQPEVLRQLLTKEFTAIQKAARDLRDREIRYVLVAARGSSDNAARYAKYLFASQLGLQVALATPSLFTLYGKPPHLREALVIGISQSGQSEDIVAVLAEAKEQECPTLAVTNSPDSPLAGHADYVINLHAGAERAVAATKTYTAQLTSLALLAAAWRPAEEKIRELEALPEKVLNALEQEEALAEAVELFVESESCLVIGRGYNYSTAFEIALKLKEVCYLAADPYSPADFLHGPIAMFDPGDPAIVVAPDGAPFEQLKQFSAMLLEKGASLVVISDLPEALGLAHVPLPVPSGVPEWLSPIACVVPGQLFALRLALARGNDPDSPRGLEKVTITR